jgi:V/A-type H+-transporting ATPase subunit C
LAEEGNGNSFEKATDDFLLEHLRTTRFLAFGPEPLFAHLAAREYESMNLRIIMAGKTHGIPGDSLKERLRISYV